MIIAGFIGIAFGILLFKKPNIFKRGIWKKTAIAQRILSPINYEKYNKIIGLSYIVIGITFVFYGDHIKVWLSNKISRNAPTEEQIAQSQYEVWSERFKNIFTEGCIKGALKTVTESSISDSKKKQIEAVCLCMSNRTESAHLFPSKFNPLVDSETSYFHKIAPIYKNYLNSEEGKRVVSECVKLN